MTVNELLERGVEKIYPSREFLEKRFGEGKPLTVYLGIDPTAPTLHLGNAIALRKLAQFQQLGHKVILLIGDFTALSGDPDKMSTRERMTEEKVIENCKQYKEQASALLDFGGNNPAELKFNSAWLKKMNFADVVDLASHVTVRQILERDLFVRRMAEQREVYLHEFLYPLMQGYDSVAMDVDGEIGGNDQTFNMLVGRDLMKKMLGKEKFVMTLKLLADADGVKMGKTMGNMVSLDQSPEEMFGAVMSWSDAMIAPGFELCTDLNADEFGDIDKNPMEAKLRLAMEIVRQYHGDAGAKAGRDHFERVVQNKETPDDVPEVSVTRGDLLSEILVREKIVKSKAEFSRLVKEGAVEAMNEGIIESPHKKVEAPMMIRVGKRRFLKISIN